ncbi:MAG: shikimate dehydrogenase family protein [Silvanigrellaceae bacterium]
MQSHFNLPDGQSQFCALFGKELGRSPSPATHTAWARAAGLNLQYSALQTQNEGEFHALVDGLRGSLNFRGGNITNPFKTTAMRLDSVGIDTSAFRCGAANTLYRVGETAGHGWRIANTDLYGCSESLKKILEEIAVESRSLKVVILGTGAMMRTCVCALEDLPGFLNTIETILILGRCNAFDVNFRSVSVPQKKLDLKYAHFNEVIHIGEKSSNSKAHQHLICINTLPSGTSSEANALAELSLTKLGLQMQWTSKHLFCVGYGDLRLHRWAEQKGWQVVNGDLLFEIQARASFKLWTGVEAPSLPTALQPT